MAGNVLNIKVCSLLKHYQCLTGNKPAICHCSYNLPLAASKDRQYEEFNIYNS